MDSYLPKGEAFISKAARISLASPFTYGGALTKSQITQIYTEAVDFGLEHLKSSSSFHDELAQQVMEADMEQTKLIVLDFLVQDYAYTVHNLRSTEFKSAVSAFGIQDLDICAEQIQKIVKELQ